MMRKVISLAARGRGAVSPNPMVGAIVVKRGLIVARGYHRAFGKPHAEVEALKKINFRGQEGTLYVNLEPCVHYGKTPPCVESIIRSGIREVVVGMRDPNPLVSGKGIRMLKANGIRVENGVLNKECKKLNESYVKYVTKKLPFVVLKMAMTLDGKIALAKRESQWITSSKARSYAHDLRSSADAVLVGAKTVEVDDPILNTRHARRFKKNPLRVVFDARLSTDPRSRVYNRRLGGETIVFTNAQHSKRIRNFEMRGVRVIVLKGGAYINVGMALKQLAAKNVTSILVEGGKEIFTSFMNEGVVDKVIIIYGNKIVGGEKSLAGFGEIKVSKLNQAFTLKDLSAIKLGQDIVISGYL